jgi:outer membrane protein
MVRRSMILAAGVALSVASGCARPAPEPADPDPSGVSVVVDDVPAGIAPAGIAIAESPRPHHLPLAADGSLPLTVEDAVLLALSHNRDLAVRRYDPVVAATFAQIERGVYDPRVFAGLSLSEERVSQTDRATGTLFDVESAERNAEVGLRQRLPTGTDIALALQQRTDDSTRTPEQQESRIGLTVTQALMRGFGPAVNLAAVRQAALDADISLFELRGYTEALVAEVEITYWRLVQATRRMQLVRESLGLAERQRDDTRTRIEFGAEAATTLAATESEIARRQQALVEAQADRRDQQLRLLRQIAAGGDAGPALILLSDPPLDPPLDPPIDPPLDPPLDHADDSPSAAAVDQRIALALARRADLAEARLRLWQRRLDVVVTANGTLPRLDFFADLGKTGFGSSFDESLENLDGETWDYTVGLDFSYPLGNRSADARRIAAVAGRAQAQAAIVNLEQLIAYEVRQAWNDVLRATDLLAAARTTARLQRTTAEAEADRLEAGVGTTLAVAFAQRDLLAAEVAIVDAAVASRIARVRLYLAEGSLLERRGLVLPPAPADGRP